MPSADWARARDIRLSSELESGDDTALSATVDTLVASGLLTRYEAGSENVYSIDPAKHPMASYYRNIIAHHFLDRAMIELALFDLRDADSGDATAAFWARIDRLRDLFKFEFFYPPRDEHRAAIEAELARIDPVWDRRLASGDRGVAQLLRRCQPVVGHAILLPFAEASPGATGLELLLPQTLHWAARANCKPAQALAKVTQAAARILGIDAGHLGVGAVADICLYDPDAHWRVTPASLTSQGKNTPFLGHEVRGEVVFTLVAGQGGPVRTVAWCSGGAQGYFEAAIAAGAQWGRFDVLITGRARMRYQR